MAGAYHKYICPICSANLYKWKLGAVRRIECPNQCYGYYKFETGKTTYQVQIRIFGKIFDMVDTIKGNKVVYKSFSNVTKEIKYWKENERYIMKLTFLDSNKWLGWPK